MQIDLRSDTVTRPDNGMIERMMSAPVGDDVFGEDPTVQQLEVMLAAKFGKEAGLFCPSGTMSNQIAIKLHTQPGNELICDETSHIYQYEGAGIAFNSGVQAKLIRAERGIISPEQIRALINPEYDWLAKSALISIENTVNKAGGSCYQLAQMESIASLCKELELPLHLDGARIYNAIVKMGYSELQVGSLFDTISVCLSKGLGAPVGSVLLGSATTIKKARRIRKVLGGGMRQAGILAAAGLYALEKNVIKLNQDHFRAKVLSEELAKIPVVKEILPVETNLVIAILQGCTEVEFLDKLSQHGIKAVAFGKNTIRFVTHLDFTDTMLDKVVKVFKEWK